MEEADTSIEEARRIAGEAITALEAKGQLTPDDEYALLQFRAILSVSTPGARKIIEALCDAADGPVSPERIAAAIFGPPVPDRPN
jgi:hypothetical protein